MTQELIKRDVREKNEKRRLEITSLLLGHSISLTPPLHPPICDKKDHPGTIRWFQTQNI